MFQTLKRIYRSTSVAVIRTFASVFAKPLRTDDMKSVLIISPHPDDETFGCNGLIRELVQHKKDVNVVILSKGEGIGKNSEYEGSKIIDIRKGLTEKVFRNIGLSLDKLRFLDFPDGDFIHTPTKEIERLDRIIKEISPDTIFYPHPWEGSPDHNKTAKIVENSTKNLPIKKFQFCVWVWHHMRMHLSFLMDYRNSYLLSIDKDTKEVDVDFYASAFYVTVFYNSGIVPAHLLKSVKWNNELYFQA